MAQNPHLLTDHQKFVTGVYVCGPYGCAKFGANLTASTAEKVEFLKKNSRWRTAAVLKTVTSAYL